MIDILGILGKCQKCDNVGWLPIAWLSNKGMRQNSGVAACDCEHGEARMTQELTRGQHKAKPVRYYDYPKSMITTATTQLEIYQHFREREKTLTKKAEENRLAYEQRKKENDGRKKETRTSV